jgi:uncharacterized membrane protein
MVETPFKTLVEYVVISRKTLKQHETRLRSFTSVICFLYSGISLLIFLSFLWFLILGGNIPLLGKLFATSAVQDWRVFSIVTLMTWIIVILSFVSFSGSLITGIFLTRTKNKLVVKKVEEEKEQEVHADLLMPGEKKIIEVLEDNDGSMTQSELTIESEMSKVKLHRYLKKLEAKKIISKHAYGMTNRIKLEKKLKS